MKLLEDTGAPMRQVVVFFKAVDHARLADPGPQLQKVLDFRRQLESERSLLFTTFDDPGAFEQRLRRHLATWLYDHEHGHAAKPGRPPRPDTKLAPAQPVGSIRLLQIAPDAFQQDLQGHLIRWPSGRWQSTTSKAGRPTQPADKELAPPQPTKSIPLPQSSGSPLLKRARQLANEGALTDAEALYALAIASGTSPHAFNVYGQFLLRVGRLAQAEAMFERLIKLSESAGEKWKAVGHVGLGMIRRRRGDLPGAERFYSQALEITQRLNSKGHTAFILGALGALSYERGNPARAEAMTRKALEINLELKHDEGLAASYGNLGAVLLRQGHLDEAEESLRKAVEINERINRVHGLAVNYANLGRIYKERGDLNRAEEMTCEAVKLNEKLGRPVGLAASFGILADIFLKRGETGPAEEMLAKAIEINERLGRQSGLAGNYRALGELCLRRGDVARAEEAFRKALELNVKLGRQDGMANTYQGIGLTYAQKGELAAARSMLTAARDLFTSLGMSLRAKEAQAKLDGLSSEAKHA